MKRRAIYVGTPMKRIGPFNSNLYLGYGMTGIVVYADRLVSRFCSDDGNEWYVSTFDLYYGSNS